ncbi:olfactory receptor 6N2-like [Melanotaenia boesemani]|uniref:olfactory receptor 6N2-like n=1 Tax=Melanotaenia boesemani TaxID=1250792 RepID=UPI001C0585F9|nr:olfactory receptor 6N2-like [Melanotaenia boesemani]
MNVSYINLSGHVEVEKYRYLYFVITFTVYSLIICSNCTIVGLIVIHRSLHEPMYIFIAALLINSLLFSTNIFPKLMIDFLSDEQIISYQACLFQCFTFYSLSASEFLLLAAMSYDRYVSICKPLQYPTIMTGKKVSMFLALAWLLPACQIAGPVVRNANSKLCSFTLKGIFCNNTINNLCCEISKPLMIYGLVVMFNVALCPMLFILFTYVKILIITCQSGGEVRRKAAQTCLPHLLVLINYSCLVTYDMVIVRLESDLPKTACFVLTLQIITYNPLFNPIIYGLKMKEINKHLKNIFLSK